MMSGPGALVDAILAAHAAELGADRLAYRNHVRRVLRFFERLAGAAPSHVVVAAAFHDLGIWVDRTFDYLGPSVRLARAYAEATEFEPFAAEIEATILNHHKLTPYEGPFSGSVETFRKADLVDVSLGLIRFGIPRADVRATRAALPNAGFHRRLVALTGRQLVRTPWRPLPMVRW